MQGSKWNNCNTESPEFASPVVDKSWSSNYKENVPIKAKNSPLCENTLSPKDSSKLKFELQKMMEDEDISQDSLDLSSCDDISAAIEKFEKLLNSDVKLSDSLKKMKQSLGSSGNDWDMNDRDSSQEHKSNTSADQEEEKSTLKCSTAASETKEADTSSEIAHYLSNSDFSVTQFLNKTDSSMVSPLDRLKNQRKEVIAKIKEMCDSFCKYNRKDRETYLQEMHLILRVLTLEQITEHVLPSFSIYIDEADELQLKFLQVYPDVIDCLFLNDQENAIDHIVLTVFPMFENFLKKANVEITQKALETLEKICVKSGKESASSLNTMLTSLCADFSKNQILIFKILSKFAKEHMETKDIDDFCLAFWQEVQGVQEPTAKKALIQALASISQNCTPKVLLKYILPQFLELCSDSHWGVRKACAEQLPELSTGLCKLKTMEEESLINLFVEVDKLITDGSKWVKNTIFQEFGKVIFPFSSHPGSNFGRRIDKLIVTYVEESNSEDLEEPDEINLSVAFNFPCIILVSSPKLWKFLREHYLKLCGHSNLKIRTSLASSFHAVFKTLHGCQTLAQFEPHLTEVFCNFMSDIEVIKHKLLSNASSFWHLWSQQTQEDLFKIICDFYSFEDDWRLQKLKAEFIPTVVKIYPIEKLASHELLTKWQKLLECDNFTVQKATAENLTPYLLKAYIEGNKATKKFAVKFAESYAGSEKYKSRLLFIHMTHSLIKDCPKMFKKKFSKLYITLSKDKVTNIKILLANTLQNYSEEISKMPRLEEVEANLQDSDVPEIAQVYNKVEKEQVCTLPISYDVFYLNFINQPDPTLIEHLNLAASVDKDEILVDKSEDEYLKKEQTKDGQEGSLPQTQGKKKAKVTKDEFQELDDFLDQIGV